MSDFSLLEDRLKKDGIKFAGSLIDNPSEKNTVIAFIYIQRDKRNLQIPSNQLLKKITERELENGIVLEFILLNEKLENVEIGLRSNLLYKFGDNVRNSFLKSTNKTTIVWIVPKTAISDELHQEIASHCKQFLDLFDLEFSELQLTTNQNTVTKTACLKVLRRFSPATQEKLEKEIEKLGFAIPSQNLLSRILDNLRKDGFVMRQKSNERYALTFKALRSLGTSKNRNSPDITRMLEIGKRKDYY